MKLSLIVGSVAGTLDWNAACEKIGSSTEKETSIIISRGIPEQAKLLTKSTKN